MKCKVSIDTLNTCSSTDLILKISFLGKRFGQSTITALFAFDDGLIVIRGSCRYQTGKNN